MIRDPEKRRAYTRRWYHENREKSNERTRAYRKENRAKVRKWKKNERERMAAKGLTAHGTPLLSKRERLKQRRRKYEQMVAAIHSKGMTLQDVARMGGKARAAMLAPEQHREHMDWMRDKSIRKLSIRRQVKELIGESGLRALRE